MKTVCRFDTPWKAFTPILVTLDGMIIEVKPVFFNAISPILISNDVLEKIIEVKPVAFRNASYPILL